MWALLSCHLYQSLQHLVRLGPDHGPACGQEGRHSRYPKPARVIPVVIHRGSVFALGKDPLRLVRVEVEV